MVTTFSCLPSMATRPLVVDISGSAVHETKKWVSAQMEKASKDESSNIAPCEFMLTDFSRMNGWGTSAAERLIWSTTTL